MSQQNANEIAPGPEKTVLLFAKYPEPGRVKTRLARDIGADAAAELYGLFVSDLCARLLAGGFHVTLLFTPAEREEDFARRLSVPAMAPQEGADLGERMQNALLAAFAKGAAWALCLGADVPDVPLAYVERAFALLASGAPVLGPARDGGYYLIGFSRRRFVREAFAGIPWGGPEVFSRTLAALRSRGADPALLPPWSDVDTVADLRDLAARQREAPTLSPGARAMLEGFA